MKKHLLLLLIIFSPLFAISQEEVSKEDISLSGIWERDDGKTRKIENVRGGIKFITERNEFFYKRIDTNVYQMEWYTTKSGGVYRWTMYVKDYDTFYNYYENKAYKSTTPRIYKRYAL